jgi:isopenicillin N synthase-like dioxygenase
LSGTNQWPDLDGFRPVLERYHEAMCELGQRLVRLFAAGLGDDGGVLTASFRPPTTWLRLLHSPPVDPQAPDDLYGSAPHNDFGFITILAQDEVGGLQVRDAAGQWIDVPPRPGAFVMNVGDMLHRWSNGRLISTPHRVHNRSGRERYSVPFFFDPHVSTVVAPLDCCVDDDHPARFDPIEFEGFLRHELATSYDRHRDGTP